MKPEKREPLKREPLKPKPVKRHGGPAPTGVSKTHAKRDRARALAQKRKQKELHHTPGGKWDGGGLGMRATWRCWGASTCVGTAAGLGAAGLGGSL